MTYTTKNPAALSTPNHNGCTIDRPVTQWPAFDNNHEYCGEIRRIDPWAVPGAVYESLNLPDNLDLFLTSEGHWAPTLEIAEHLLINTEAPAEFIVSGATLSLFVPPQWAEENGNPNAYDDYRVFRTAAGGWDAEEAQELVLVEANCWEIEEPQERERYSINACIPYAVGLQLIKKLKNSGIEASITAGGIALVPTADQLDAMYRVCEVYKVTPFKGGTTHQEQVAGEVPVSNETCRRSSSVGLAEVF
jgi:hypothetical protein